MDRQMEPAPMGVPGEMYIGGAGLARGYLNRPELTAERFVPDPTGEKNGERLYRTGDIARRLSEGRLEFIGRSDHQVKVRGYRIELAEIEAALSQCEGVGQAGVIAREDESGERQLTGYVTAQNAVLSQDALKSALREKLPDFMVPGTVLVLEAMPLMANGKVDRKALPSPRRDKHEGGANARTPVEEILASIWGEVLKLERVSVHEDFFALGGHSLSATQVIARISRALSVDLPLRAMFESPTVAGLAELVERARPKGPTPPIPPLRPARRTPRLPLSFAQQRLWFIEQLDPGRDTYNIPGAVRLTGELLVPALERAFAELVNRHEALRTHFIAESGEAFQVIEESVPLAIAVYDLTGLEKSQREPEAFRVARREAAEPFDLSRGPLLRVKLIRLRERDHLLLVTMHHIVSDAWSSGVLVREFSAIYAALAAGAEPVLTPLPIQYADYTIWQREWLRGEVLERQLRYWRAQPLQGKPLDLPLDYPRQKLESHSGAVLEFSLAREFSAQLRQTPPRRAPPTLFSLTPSFILL